MLEGPIRVLLIEDDRDDYVLTRDLLAEVPGRPFVLEWVADCDSGLQALVRCDHDVCLLDYRLGARTGLELLQEASAQGCKAPAILLTGESEPELDREALVAGVADYLEKGRFNAMELCRAIRYAMQQRRHADELERKVAERTAELAAANASLQEVDRRRTEFLALLAHELRNPLAPIRHALQILKLSDGKDPSPTIDMMGRQLGHMVSLIDDLLDISRISKGKIELRRGRVELASFVHHAVEAARSLVECKNHELTVSLPPQAIYLNADPTRMTQVIGNLLNNACKFTGHGGRIRLSAEREGESVLIRVQDNGIGIAAEQLPWIFEMFSQVDASIQRSQGGLGIGLSLVRNLVELHGGTIEARSAGVGQGTEMLLRLPALPEDAAAPAVSAPQATIDARAPRRRILVVDDNLDSAQSLAILLEIDGHETHVAHDGLAALEAATSLRPEVILLDIGLPQLDGYEVCRRIRKLPWGQGLMLVALTGWGQAEDRRKSSEAGFDHHLVKPVDHAALTRLLAGL